MVVKHVKWCLKAVLQQLQFAGSSFLNVRICSFPLSLMTVNEQSLVFKTCILT